VFAADRRPLRTVERPLRTSDHSKYASRAVDLFVISYDAYQALRGYIYGPIIKGNALITVLPSAVRS